jgi:hypothetical protein
LVYLAANGTNFRGGKTALENKPAKDQIDLETAQEHFNLEFRFAPPRAPHFQGLVERFVGAAKLAIHSTVRAHTLTDEELRTVFLCAMGHLNNIPIAYTVKSDTDFHYQHLMPSHFLMGSAYNSNRRKSDLEENKYGKTSQQNFSPGGSDKDKQRRTECACPYESKITIYVCPRAKILYEPTKILYEPTTSLNIPSPR